MILYNLINVRNVRGNEFFHSKLKTKEIPDFFVIHTLKLTIARTNVPILSSYHFFSGLFKVDRNIMAHIITYPQYSHPDKIK